MFDIRKKSVKHKILVVVTVSKLGSSCNLVSYTI